MEDTLITIAQALGSGLLVGGVYGLFAIGFSLAFGVMRIVNFAHGELVMLGMYLGYVFFATTGLDPILALPVAVVAFALLGAALYQGLYARFVGKATLQQLLVAVALALVIQILTQIAFGPDTRAVPSSLGAGYLLLGPLFFSHGQIITFGVAVVTVLLVELLLRHTHWGRLVRAISDDPDTAELVGVDARLVNVSAFALSAVLAGVAGVVLVTFYPVNPVTGFALMPIALIATVVGGLGSIGGAFLGGILCAVVQQLTSAFFSTALQDVPLYLMLLAFLAWRPYGLMGRAAAH